MANSNGWGDGSANNAIGWGQGANNAIGWGDIHADSWAGATDISGLPTTDPDAQAFITAAAITDPTQQAAINTLVVDLKGYSIWTKMKAIYPFVGGTNSQHTWNLRNTAQYQISWQGGVTSSNLGIKFNGTNSYGITGFNPSLNSTLNSNGLGFYSGTNLSETSSDPVNIGALIASDFYSIVKSNTLLNSRLNLNPVNASSIIMTGFFSGQKTSSTVTTIYKEATSLATGIGGGALPNLNLFLGTLNLSGSPYSLGYIRNDMRFAYISDGLNSTEISNLYTAVQAFQTTLGRNV